MTEFESESLETFYAVRESIPLAMSSKADYMLLMASIRDMIQKLENVKFGCASGRHAGRCDCLPNKPGRAIR